MNGVVHLSQGTSLGAAEKRDFVRQCGWKRQAIDARLYQLGAKFLARSSATTYGAMPGSSLHLELNLLRRIGLSPRKAIAAATTSYVRGLWPDVGRTKTGRNADLLILNKDPRSDLSALDATDEVILIGSL